MSSLFSLASLILVVGAIAFFSMRTTALPTTPHVTPSPSVNEVSESTDVLSAINSAKEAKQLIEAKNQEIGKTALNLSGRGLTQVPGDTFTRTELTVLDVSHNALTGALQAEVRHLGNLTTLDMSYNQFTGVPAEVGQLSNLEVLNLSHNKLTGLPYELGNLKNLKLLDLSGNEYSEADLAIIKQTLPQTTVIKTE